MPWNETDPVNERVKFVAAHQSGVETMSELCERFGISRKTGYKILQRYRSDGPVCQRYWQRGGRWFTIVEWYTTTIPREAVRNHATYATLVAPFRTR